MRRLSLQLRALLLRSLNQRKLSDLPMQKYPRENIKRHSPGRKQYCVAVMAKKKLKIDEVKEKVKMKLNDYQPEQSPAMNMIMLESEKREQNRGFFSAIIGKNYYIYIMMSWTDSQDIQTVVDKNV